MSSNWGGPSGGYPPDGGQGGPGQRPPPPNGPPPWGQGGPGGPAWQPQQPPYGGPPTGPAGYGAGAHLGSGRRDDVPDPTRPIGSSLDPQRPIHAPTPPPPSKTPLIVIGAIVLATLIAVGIGGFNVWRADQQARTEPSPSVNAPTGSPLPANLKRFVTATCESGVFGVTDHEREGSDLYIKVSITCEQGSYDVTDNAIAIFDRDSQDYRNEVPFDRETLGEQTIADGQTVEGWAKFSSVPTGEVTVLLLGYSRTTTAVPIDT